MRVCVRAPPELRCFFLGGGGVLGGGWGEVVGHNMYHTPSSYASGGGCTVNLNRYAHQTGLPLEIVFPECKS